MKIGKHLLAMAIASLAACSTNPSEDTSSHDNSFNQGDSPNKNNEADALPKNGLTTFDNEVPSDWIRISADGFSFSAPPDMVEREVQGIDSYVGSYRNDTFDLNFDYGMYTAEAENPDELIAGKAAKITNQDRDSAVDGIPYKKYSGVNFEDIGRPGVNLTMYIYGKTKVDQATAKIIFRSIRID